MILMKPNIGIIGSPEDDECESEGVGGLSFDRSHIMDDGIHRRDHEKFETTDSGISGLGQILNLSLSLGQLLSQSQSANGPHAVKGQLRRFATHKAWGGKRLRC